MTKIVFLDLEGVLIHELSDKRHNQHKRIESPELRAEILAEFPSRIDPKCVERLKAFQDQYGFLIVFSSSIRKLHQSLQSLIDDYPSSGLADLKYHEDWRTPTARNTYQGNPEDLEYWCKIHSKPVAEETAKYWRGQDVQDWLSKHPEVEQYLAIDDSPDFYPTPMHNSLWIRNGNYYGGIGFYEPEIVDEAFERVFGASVK